MYMCICTSFKTYLHCRDLVRAGILGWEPQTIISVLTTMGSAPRIHPYAFSSCLSVLWGCGRRSMRLMNWREVLGGVALGSCTWGQGNQSPPAGDTTAALFWQRDWPVSLLMLGSGEAGGILSGWDACQGKAFPRLQTASSTLGAF